jgi:catechol 2,3-dioxygenase-like lactoylglutathione lyase family enzyme
VPSHDQVAAARFIASLLDVPWEERRGHFSPVYVNATCTLDFGDWEQFEGHHYCFQVSDAEFDQIFARVQASGIKYRSSPRGPDDMAVNTRLGGRNFYWTDRDGHIWEVLTLSYARQQAAASVGSSAP